MPSSCTSSTTPWPPPGHRPRPTPRRRRRHRAAVSLPAGRGPRRPGREPGPGRRLLPANHRRTVLDARPLGATGAALEPGQEWDSAEFELCIRLLGKRPNLEQVCDDPLIGRLLGLTLALGWANERDEPGGWVTVLGEFFEEDGRIAHEELRGAVDMLLEHAPRSPKACASGVAKAGADAGCDSGDGLSKRPQTASAPPRPSIR